MFVLSPLSRWNRPGRTVDGLRSRTPQASGTTSNVLACSTYHAARLRGTQATAGICSSRPRHSDTAHHVRDRDERSSTMFPVGRCRTGSSKGGKRGMIPKARRSSNRAASNKENSRLPFAKYPCPHHDRLLQLLQRRLRSRHIPPCFASLRGQSPAA
jgi:hypothetical protein